VHNGTGDELFAVAGPPPPPRGPGPPGPGAAFATPVPAPIIGRPKELLAGPQIAAAIATPAASCLIFMTIPTQ
jgi:hypothetical protein